MKSNHAGAVIAAIACIFLAGCADSPKDVAEKWQKAVIKGSVDEANKYSSETMPVLNAMVVSKMTDNNKKKEFSKIKFTREEIHGDTATVFFKEGENKEEQNLELIKIDGQWKVHARK